MLDIAQGARAERKQRTSAAIEGKKATAAERERLIRDTLSEVKAERTANGRKTSKGEIIQIIIERLGVGDRTVRKYIKGLI